jgi:two-component system sensor histidine kinase EvgS
VILKRTQTIKEEIDKKHDLIINKFKLTIIDTGSGISKEGLKKMFMDFSRLQEHADINQRGTGLGLSICKRIIEKMGGTVKVES